MSSYPVKWFSSHDAAGAAVAGAPVLSGTAGSLISVLDACLLTGYGTVTVASLVVSSGVATATVSAGHGFLDQQIVLIAGAAPSALNGEQRITRTSATTFTFATTAANGTASGTITARLAPVGWAKPYSGASLAVYRSTDPAATGLHLRIDDAAAQYARVRVYESMSSVDIGIGPCPTDAQVSGGLYWMRSASAGSTARGWRLFGDSRALYLFVNWDGSGQYSPYFSGDLAGWLAGDAWAAGVVGHAQQPSGPAQYISLTALGASPLYGQYLLRAASGAAGAGKFALTTVGAGGTQANMGSYGSAWPTPDGQMTTAPILVCDGATPWAGTTRGTLPGAVMRLHPGADTADAMYADSSGTTWYLQRVASFAAGNIATLPISLGAWR